jgi:hypothetical protein
MEASMRRRLPSKSIAHWFRLQVATRQRLAILGSGQAGAAGWLIS